MDKYGYTEAPIATKDDLDMVKLIYNFTCTGMALSGTGRFQDAANFLDTSYAKIFEPIVNCDRLHAAKRLVNLNDRIKQVDIGCDDDDMDEDDDAEAYMRFKKGL